ncbi:MAG: DNA-binding response regulator [Bacteroidetes bacterium GWF2_49_14]|nr:MAG: DNA-binding response regulator [Bacteroidetes bacterium GWF2_49_14]HBB92639.1 DNA-binding response regulator [Bacteroidales bacterium]
MPVLIIEDEAALRKSMVTYLESAGYSCTAAGSYHESLRVIDLQDYYCVLVDLGLPDGDGLSLIRLMKENKATCGIIVVSARDTLEDRVRGLETGADDYLVKPFHLSELNARIQSVIRRTRRGGHISLTYRGLAVDPEGKTATLGGEQLDLTKKEFNILVYLLTNLNKVVTKDSIAEHIWGDNFYGVEYSDAVYTHMKNLRRKLEQKTGEIWIQTVYGMGYKMEDGK